MAAIAAVHAVYRCHGPRARLPVTPHPHECPSFRAVIATGGRLSVRPYPVQWFRLSVTSAFSDWIIASTKTAKNSCSLTFTRGRAHPAFVDAVVSAPALSRQIVAGLSRLSSVALRGLLVHSNRKSSNTTARGHLGKDIFALSPLHEHAVAWSEVLLAQTAGLEPALPLCTA